MPNVTFEFRTRGAEQVRQQIQRTLNAAREGQRAVSGGRSGPAMDARNVQAATQVFLREYAVRKEAARKETEAVARAERRVTQIMEVEGANRSRASQREQQQRLRGLAEYVRAAQRAEGQVRTAQQQRRQGPAFVNTSAQANLRAGASIARRGLEAVGDYGDQVRTQHERRRAIELSATQLAAGDIGNASLAPMLVNASQQVATNTGQTPEAVMAGLNRAQSRFSALGDAGARASYLTQVLPQLAQLATATNTPLEAVVDTAGELQRQLGIDNSQLADRLAQLVVQGRNGSIAFQDLAQHMGVVGGAATRFLGSSGAASGHSMATTGALFQMAGRAGGSGDEAATRARAFLDNFSSARGQRRLTALLGHRVLDRSGQVITRDGETQSDAFQRILEEAYRRSGGNSDRFLTGVAGVNTRARSLGDQLFKDLQRHGGKANDLASLTSGSVSASFGNTITPAFQAVRGTEAMQAQARANALFYRQTGQGGSFAQSTEQQLASLRESSPFLASLLDNTFSRGALDATNATIAASETSRFAGQNGPATTRGDLMHRIAQGRAVQEQDAAFSGFSGTIAGAVLPDSARQWLLNRATSRIEGEMRSDDAAAGRDSNARLRNPDQPLQLAPETVVAIGAAVGQAVSVAVGAPQGKVHAANVAALDATHRASGGVHNR